MDYDEFVDRVERRGRLRTYYQAEVAVDAVLTTLGERISAGQTETLAAQLPDELASSLRSTDEPEPFGLREFLDRLERRETGESPVSSTVPKHHAQVVLGVLADATDDELAGTTAQLPGEYDRLFRYDAVEE